MSTRDLTLWKIAASEGEHGREESLGRQNPAPDERPTAQRGDRLWLLAFAPDQVHRPPLRGPLIRRRIPPAEHPRDTPRCTSRTADRQTVAEWGDSVGGRWDIAAQQLFQLL